jgi:CheY-like chemotaxis protein
MDSAQSKNRLLLVDGDPKSLRVLDVSLKKAGFEVGTATSGREALTALESTIPDLIISDTDLDEMDGFDLCSQIKARPDWAKIPFIFVSGRKSIEDKIRGLELGVDDYLTKPIYIKEIGIRVRTALQRAERERMESRREGRTRFAGDLSDVGVVDLVQTIELNRKSGIIHIVNRDNRRGSIFFRDGKVIDAEVGRLSGAHALYRLFSWSEGQFAVEFKQIRRHDVIDVPMAALLMEGMRRLDESTHLLETFPGSTSVLEVDCRVLAEELAELPDEMNSVLRLCDGARTLQEVVEDCDQPDLEALTIINKLYKQQIIFAREAPDRSGESEPGERLARWLSEGDAEDGAAAEDVGTSSEFATPLELGQDEDVVPARTPEPTTMATPTRSDGEEHRADDGHGDETASHVSETTSESKDVGAQAPDGKNVALATPPGDANARDHTDAQNRPPEVPIAPLANVLSGEETMAAALQPQLDARTEGSNEFSQPAETLKGLPVDNLFGEQDDDARLKSAREQVAETGTRTVTAEWSIAPEQRTTKPLGVAERLLSDDSALRASAMHEAIAEEEARVEGPVQTDRNTREYGNTAALVDGVVSSAHEIRSEAPVVPQPERPAKEVDWGAWDTRQAKDSSAKDPSGKKVGDANAPLPAPSLTDSAPVAADSQDANATEANASKMSSTAPAEAEPALLDKPAPAPAKSDDRKASVPTSATNEAPAGVAEVAPAPPSPLATTVPSQPTADSAPLQVPPAETAKPRTAKRPTSSRQVWLVVLGAFSLGVVGLVVLLGREIPRPDAASASAPPAVALPAPPSPARPSESAKLVVAAKPPGGTAKDSVGRGAAAVSPLAAELRDKCLEVDADGKGKAKAVAAACRSALDANPNGAQIMVILARAELDRGHLLEARTLAKKAIATDPQRFDAYVLLGNAEQEAGKIDEARVAYKKYLDLAPTGPYARELRAILNNL